jgi:hypothetical protein
MYPSATLQLLLPGRLDPSQIPTGDTGYVVYVQTEKNSSIRRKKNQKMPTHGIEPWILSYQTQTRVFTSDTPYHLAKRARAARSSVWKV